MRSKFFILLILFLGISAFSYAQSKTDTPIDKKDASTQVITVDQTKSTDCPHHQQTVSKSDCKWVDVNKDGVCDICGKKDCGDKCKSGLDKKCDPTACQYHKDGVKSAGCCPYKDGKKTK
jgi:hypothetical protein